MYKVIYRAYRPEVFEDVLGQNHIVKVLKNQINNNTVNHAYLFCGTRGTGKTTAARLLAKGLNCLNENKPCGVCDNCLAIKEGNFIDLIEIDAASNTGVDNIRELRESVNYPPSVGRTKVYIIDEVHMLSNSAFNALLKTLEEPPENVVFILATTEPNKLPQTILSRCMRMDFRRVGLDELIGRMKMICGELNVEITNEAVNLIAINADGSVRDGLTLLDQCISGRDGEIDRTQVLDSLGAVGEDTYIELTNYVIGKDPSSGVLLLDKILAGGKDARQVLMGWLVHYRNLLMAKYVKNPENMLNMSMENIETVKKQSEVLDLVEINDGILEISKTISEAKYSSKPRILLELCLVKLASTMVSGIQTQGRVMSSAPINIKAAKEEEASKAHKTATDNSKGNPITVDTTSKAEVEKLWHRIIDEALITKGHYLTLKSTSAKGIKENEIVIGTTNPVVYGMIDSDKEFFADLCEKVSGTRRYIKVIDMDQKIEETSENFDAVVSTVSSLFGQEVKLEK
ncbi:MAG: DNA polymerase III subunit gamma/tau [Anaerovoracaceae bacterium]